MDSTASRRQLDVLKLYGDLVSARDDWSGVLMLASGAAAETVPPAASLLNGTTLWLTGDTSEAKAAMRRGSVDFVVNTLDEALRTLKNQIRQGRPLGVALTGNVTDILTEIVARGVLPQWMLGSRETYDASRARIQSLQAGGMAFRFGPMRAEDAERREPPAMLLHRNRYFAFHVHVESLQELREVDAYLLSALADGETAVTRWLQRISRYVRDTPEGGRWVWLTEEQFHALPGSWRVSAASAP